MHHRWTFLVLVVGICTYTILQSCVAPILPLLARELHTTRATSTWIVTANLLSASVCTPILGRMGDRIGKERVLIATLTFAGVGCVVGALASSIGVMIAARAVQGTAGAVVPLAFGIIRDEFPRAKVSGAVGTLSALLGVGGAAGLVVTGPIVETIGYRWLFWIPCFAFGATAVATAIVVPASPIRTPGRISWLAGIAMSAWLISLLLGVTRGPRSGWTSRPVVGLLTVAFVGVVTWVWLELRSDSPLIDMRLMRTTKLWTTNLVALLVGFGMYSILAFVPQFLQTPTDLGYGFSSTISESGLTLLPLSVMFLMSGTASGWLSRRFSSELSLVFGSATSGAAFLVLAFAHSTRGHILVAMILLGVGFGLAFAAMSSIVVHAVPSHQTGAASGMNANIRMIGGALGSALMASVLASTVNSAGVPDESGYTVGFGVLAVVVIASSIVALLIPRGAEPRMGNA